MKFEAYSRSGAYLGFVTAVSDDEAMKEANSTYSARHKPLMLECRERNEQWLQAERDAKWEYRMSQQ